MEVNSPTDKDLSHWYKNDPETETRELPEATAIRCTDPLCDFYVASNDPATLDWWREIHEETAAHRVVSEP